MSTSLVRFLACATRPPVASFVFAAKGYAVGPCLAHALAQAQHGAQALALAEAFARAAQPLAPAAAPATASEEFDIRLDVVAPQDGSAVLVEVREWTNPTPVFRGGVTGLQRYFDAGFGQC